MLQLLRLAAFALLCAAGCQGVGGKQEAEWPDPTWTGPDSGDFRSTAPRTRVTTHSSPLGAVLSRLLRGKDAPDERRPRRRFRVEPDPILGEHEIGLGFTVHW